MASKKDKPIRYFEQFYQIWDEYFWMTQKKASLLSLPLSVGVKGTEYWILVTIP